MPFPLTLWLVHPDPSICEPLIARFDGLPGVIAQARRFENLPPHDCFVTAGNSFGMMTAGIDAAVVAFHGESLMTQVQNRILDEYLGEQPVGTAFVVETNTPGYPFVVHAPTMRVPGSIAGTDKVYAATLAALVVIYRHNVTHPQKISTVALPAMGAGFGGVAPSEVGRQMAAAYRNYLEPPHRFDWDMVARRQKQICYDGNRQVIRG
ncbi:macro domain-containing protein [Blastopirellula sp. J2-11]|uniref:macro domain-containing protein n=1 Tax=Blastopirellula sp. J2-11 TaxID=2943192 RepID=UPI0021C5D5EC|nr:macro domain-containing protein [Blastopirellula sp. J2-11]UUO06342.1 macro domain-containing protein [Blastopirellula sp. J2-11]